jgi:PAS domain S-box-containing protein
MLMQRLPAPADEATIWVKEDGTVKLICSTFEDWFGYSSKELFGTPLANLIVSQAKELQKCALAVT